MNFEPSEEQLALQDVLRRFCADRFPVAEARRWGDPGGFDRSRWAHLAELGTFELASPHDGAGSFADTVLAFEVLGQALVPGPLLATALGAGLVDGAATGVTILALLDGAVDPPIVEHLAGADAVLVVSHDAVRIVDTADVVAVTLDDGLDPTSTVALAEHVGEGELLGGAALASSLRHAAHLLVAALLVGLSEGATARAVGHALDREQFGRPIGSFQAVKHLLADSFARTEVARASLYAAAVTSDDSPGSGAATRATAGARHLATRAASANAKTALQVFGGMGFTWEIDAHLFVKRSWVLAATLGSPESALDTIAGRLR